MKLFDNLFNKVERGLAARNESAQEQALPRHIAIIMDGNGRWARKRGLPRSAGHAAGAETFRRIASYCRDLGVEYLTIYAFSTENWKRSQEEVNGIMGLLKTYLLEAIEKMERERVKIRFWGNLSELSPELQALARRVEALSDAITSRTQVNMCVNYGGRDEILRAVKRWVLDPNPPELSEETFSRYLYSANVPDPDLIIRPSGEQRLSNFLLWQSAYAEFYFTDVLWPDFDEREMDRALRAYRSRDRRFGNAK